ncbi:MAG: hypothetical protein JWO11_4445 [Nocardioides sp.]|nr:hypothetical protein [Nocardioides sp.]
MQLRMCTLCPYALRAQLVRRSRFDVWVIFYCEHCDRTP